MAQQPPKITQRRASVSLLYLSEHSGPQLLLHPHWLPPLSNMKSLQLRPPAQPIQTPDKQSQESQKSTIRLPAHEGKMNDKSEPVLGQANDDAEFSGLASSTQVPASASSTRDECARTETSEKSKLSDEEQKISNAKKEMIFVAFEDNKKQTLLEDYQEQRKKEFIQEYEEQIKLSHSLVETPKSSPSMPPSPKSPVSHPSATPQLPATSVLKENVTESRTHSPAPDIIDALDNMVVLTSDESMMEMVTKSPESQTSPFSSDTPSPTTPDNRDKIESLIELDYGDGLNLPNTSMDEEDCVVIDDLQDGTPLDQLVYSRLNCQLCYDSFTTPSDWVQHVTEHCIMDQGLMKRRGYPNDEGDNIDSAFRCDMCSSYFITAYDWQNHVAEAHEED